MIWNVFNSRKPWVFVGTVKATNEEMALRAAKATYRETAPVLFNRAYSHKRELEAAKV